MRVEINSAHGDSKNYFFCGEYFIICIKNIVLEAVSSRIRYCFIFKVILALLIAGCQIWVLQNFFAKKEAIKVTPISQEMY